MKRLKDWVGYARSKYNGKELRSIIREIDAEDMEALLALLEALLARLEAAEAIANYCDDIPHTVPSYLKEAWRKAAEK